MYKIAKSIADVYADMRERGHGKLTSALTAGIIPATLIASIMIAQNKPTEFDKRQARIESEYSSALERGIKPFEYNLDGNRLAYIDLNGDGVFDITKSLEKEIYVDVDMPKDVLLKVHR